ncbi:MULTISPECIES: thioesterase II family protein [Streptomyces]|uniref:Alpha/beta fold hydrolase n=1 Tax=Streptomyces sanyensis TaxID=568869 RepID=A0ABP9AGW1_9ACTN
MSATDAHARGASWVNARFTAGNPRLRLICLPQSGGGATAFTGWRPHLPEGVELAPVELPGRGSRMAEPVMGEFGPLLDALLDGLRGELDAPYALFGHSFGALLAYELALRTERDGLPSPAALFVSGSRAPQVPLGRAAVAGSSDEELAGWLLRTGGLPRELLDHPDFLREILRAVRADMAMAERYHVPEPLPVGCPLLALAGRDDEVSPPRAVAAWSSCTTAVHRTALVPGGHSYPRTHPRETVRAVREGLALAGIGL